MTYKHPNIVDVKEIVVGTKLDSIFIVMEFLEHDLKVRHHKPCYLISMIGFNARNEGRYSFLDL
jgi:hypothetical protein